jgi:hypothetical protein
MIQWKTIDIDINSGDREKNYDDITGYNIVYMWGLATQNKPDFIYFRFTICN